MKKIIKYPLIIVFMLFIFSFAIADSLTKDKDYSQLENRVLAQRPTPTIEEIISNEFTTKYEEYIDDQILGRDHWIDLKSRAEYAILKLENNGIVYGKDHYMFEKYKAVNDLRLQKNIGYIKKFMESSKDPVVFGVIPNSYMKNKDKVPYGLQNVNQYEYINKINQELSSVKNLQGKNTEIFDLINLDITYYKTDHHWTTLGAYSAYVQMMKQFGEPIVEVDQLSEKEHVVKGFFGTYFNKTKAFNAKSDTITYYDIPVAQVKIDGEQCDGLYDFSKLKTRDKYGMFLHGNNGITEIQSNNKINKSEKKSKILLIKDSYGNSLTPFLTYNYDEVVVIDLRSLRMRLSDYLAQNSFDKIVVMYNFMNLTQDANIAKITF